MIDDCTAYVLCGGASQRMGKDKAFLDWDGRPLAEFVCDRLAECFSKSICVAKTQPMADALGRRAILDPLPDRHPAIGWLAALEDATTSWVFVLGVDMPFVCPTLIHAMAELRSQSPTPRPIVPRDPEGRWHSLHLFLPSALRGDLRSRLENDPNVSLQRLCGDFGAVAVGDEIWERFDPQRESLSNLNTPDAYQSALERYRSGDRTIDRSI